MNAYSATLTSFSFSAIKLYPKSESLVEIWTEILEKRLESYGTRDGRAQRISTKLVPNRNGIDRPKIFTTGNYRPVGIQPSLRRLSQNSTFFVKMSNS